MKRNSKKEADEEIDIERLKYFMTLSAEDKLKYLNELNFFLQRVMPEKNKEIWETLKKQGF